MIFLALFACLAVAIATTSDTNLAVARNRIASQQASALAETGIQLVQRNLGGVSLSSDSSSASALYEAIAEKLEILWESSTMVDDAGVSWNDAGVTVPITLDDARGKIDLQIAVSDLIGTNPNTVTITSTGSCGNASRTARYNMMVQQGQTALSLYGVSSKSAVRLTGHGRIQGLNNNAEGSVLSATYSTSPAIRLSGNASITGDAKISNPDARIQTTGQATIGGSQSVGVGEPDWPTVDQSIFRPYATNLQTSGASGDVTLSNIRIPAGTNPTFSGNATLYGIVYVESPNKVTFSGNCTLAGLIVCEQPSVDNLNANKVTFSGNTSLSAVVPAGSQYDGLRDLTGSAVLAPGYSVKFSGQSNAVGGCMVASEFEFTGQALTGKKKKNEDDDSDEAPTFTAIRGGIINLRDSGFKVAGKATLTIDRSNLNDHPAGLTRSYKLACISGSYSE
jgi:hypothetical protein